MKRIIIALCAAALPATGNAQALGFGSAPQGSIGYNMSSASGLTQPNFSSLSDGWRMRP